MSDTPGVAPDGADDRRVADECLPAAARATAAQRTTRIEDKVTDLSRVPATALEELTVDDDAARHAGLDAEVVGVRRVGDVAPSPLQVRLARVEWVDPGDALAEGGLTGDLAVAGVDLGLQLLHRAA